MISAYATRFRRARGFSLTELAIVLAVVGSVIGGIWALAANANQKAKERQIANQILTTVTNIRSYYQGQAGIAGDFATITNNLLRRGVIPAEMIRDRAAATLVADHTWGQQASNGAAMPSGGFQVDDNSANAAGGFIGQSFRIRLNGLSRESCRKLAIQLSSGPTAEGLANIIINGTPLQPPVSVDDADPAVGSPCAPPAAPALATFDLEYRLRTSGS